MLKITPIIIFWNIHFQIDNTNTCLNKYYHIFLEDYSIELLTQDVSYSIVSKSFPKLKEPN